MLDQLVRHIGVADACAGGMEILHWRWPRGPGDPNFLDAASAKRIKLGIGNVGGRDIDSANIGIHRVRDSRPDWRS